MSIHYINEQSMKERECLWKGYIRELKNSIDALNEAQMFHRELFNRESGPIDEARFNMAAEIGKTEGPFK